MKRRGHAKLLFVLFALLPLVASCQDKSVGTNVVGYNHTEQTIEFTVDGGTGGLVQAHKGGGKFACCIGVPDPWRPGLSVTVAWSQGDDERWHERVVPVPAYDRIGDLAVHFLRNGDIKVFVTMYALWHPDYPLKGEDAQLKPGVDPTGPWGR